MMEQQVALWDGPLALLTVLEVLAVIRIVCILCKRAWKYDREFRDPLLPRQNHRAALKEVLPLMAYPIIFHATILIALADRMYTLGAKNQLFGHHVSPCRCYSKLGLACSSDSTDILTCTRSQFHRL